MANSTSSPVCLITGGASGMGLAVAEKLVSIGWYLTIVDYNEKQGKAVAQILGDKVVFLKANVADYDELASTFKATWEKRGRLDVVYNNAV
jgi:NAD(P)-dependent dehydrogenase (short-subunit alcohol dehydrogenase family)